ncbi:MAG: 30S ribosomal protein S2, partial [Terriglobia bacterium]
ANLLNMPIIALVDTNCNPQNVDYVIPSNDDAIRAIKLLVAKVADAVLEGKAMHKDDELSEEKLAAEAMAQSDRTTRRAPRIVETDEEVEDDALLGQATLAKMNASRKDEPVPAAVEETKEETKTEEKGAE